MFKGFEKTQIDGEGGVVYQENRDTMYCVNPGAIRQAVKTNRLSSGLTQKSPLINRKFSYSYFR